MIKKRSKRPAPVSIGASLGSSMKGIFPERGRLHKILLLWKELLGEEVFLNARPSSIRKNMLIITVSDPIWQSELRYFDESFMEKINAGLSDRESIKAIRYRVGYLEGARPEKDEQEGKEEAAAVAIENLPADLRESVMNVKSPSLRGLMAKIASSIKDRKEG
ncbi:MAG: DUF721 domain-containing protein [Pseudomonadota bacterium]